MATLHWILLLSYAASVGLLSRKRPAFVPAAQAAAAVVAGDFLHFVLFKRLSEAPIPFSGWDLGFFRLDLLVFCTLPAATPWLLCKDLRWPSWWAPAGLATFALSIGLLYPTVRGPEMVALQGAPRFIALASSLLLVIHGRKRLREGPELVLPIVMTAGLAGDVFGQWLQPEQAVMFWWLSHCTGSVTNLLLTLQVVRIGLKKP